jgi:hypothetical protein
MADFFYVPVLRLSNCHIHNNFYYSYCHMYNNYCSYYRVAWVIGTKARDSTIDDKEGTNNDKLDNKVNHDIYANSIKESVNNNNRSVEIKDNNKSLFQKYDSNQSGSKYDDPLELLNEITENGIDDYELVESIPLGIYINICI